MLWALCLGSLPYHSLTFKIQRLSCQSDWIEFSELTRLSVPLAEGWVWDSSPHTGLWIVTDQAEIYPQPGGGSWDPTPWEFRVLPLPRWRAVQCRLCSAHGTTFIFQRWVLISVRHLALSVYCSFCTSFALWGVDQEAPWASPAPLPLLPQPFSPSCAFPVLHSCSDSDIPSHSNALLGSHMNPTEHLLFVLGLVTISASYQVWDTSYPNQLCFCHVWEPFWFAGDFCGRAVLCECTQLHLLGLQALQCKHFWAQGGNLSSSREIPFPCVFLSVFSWLDSLSFHLPAWTLFSMEKLCLHGPAQILHPPILGKSCSALH